MPNVPDNEMEHFFRESANNNYDIEFNPAAWEKMEKKLDKEDRKVFWWRLGKLLSFALIALVSIYFILTPYLYDYQDKKKEQTVEQQQNTKEQEMSIGEDPTKEKADQTAEASSTKNSDADKHDHDLGVDNTKSSDSDDHTTLSKDDANSGDTAFNDSDGGSSGGHTSNGNNLKKDDDNEGALPIFDDNDSDPKEKVNVYIKDEDKGKESKKDIIEEAIDSKSGKVDHSKEITLSLASLPASVISPCEKEECYGNVFSQTAFMLLIKDPHTTPTHQERGGLYMNFTISPDLSGVGSFIGTDGVRSGVKAGILLEYQPVSRFSIYGGGFLSSKRYIADASEYTAPPGFWTNGEQPTDVDGSCNVLEIPIGVRYRWLKKPNHTLYVGGGINSYLLLWEKYIYNYDIPYPNPGMRGQWEGRNQNKHWLGVSMFSFGYEKKIGQKSYFQIEPFFQLPLNGIGFGSVKLYSYGTYLTLKYKIK